MKTRYFSLFKVNLKQECRFWGKEGGGTLSCGAPEAKEEEKNPFLAMGAMSGGMPTTSSKGGGTSAAGMGGTSGDQAQSSAEPTVPSCALSTEGSIPWSAPTDMVKPAPELAPKASDDCSLPSFWLDMCTDIPTDDAQFVDLQTNPER